MADKNKSRYVWSNMNIGAIRPYHHNINDNSNTDATFEVDYYSF